MGDPDQLEAYRKQLRQIIRNGGDPELAMLAWQWQNGVSRDELIDVYKEETGEA